MDQDTVNPPASTFDQAETRLAAALGRLEAALDARQLAWAEASAKAPPTEPDSAPDSALADEVARLKAENGELRALVGDAYARVDDAIGKLKAHMEG